MGLLGTAWAGGRSLPAAAAGKATRLRRPTSANGYGVGPTDLRSDARLNPWASRDVGPDLPVEVYIGPAGTIDDDELVHLLKTGQPLP